MYRDDVSEEERGVAPWEEEEEGGEGGEGGKKSMLRG
jgi:hypothetical protein